MKHVCLILGAVAGLVLSANAAAFDETRDDVIAPGLHFSVSFGGSSSPQFTSPAFNDPSIALHETGADNTRTLIVVGAIAVAVIVVVAATHHDNGRGNGY